MTLDQPLKVDIPEPFCPLLEELLIGEIIQYLDLIINIGVATNKSAVQKLGQSTVWLLVKRIQENLELLVLDVFEILFAGFEFLEVFEELCHIVFYLVWKAIDSDINMVLFRSNLACDSSKRCHVIEFSQAFVEHVHPHHAEN